ncbi:hypothetical protein [Sinorhizobium fredii]|nr:hypothetical protein [Sinorhizobium fredii]
METVLSHCVEHDNVDVESKADLFGRMRDISFSYPRSHLTGALSVAALLSKPVDEKKLGAGAILAIRDARP